MICSACRVRFPRTKIDSFRYEAGAWCSEICATDHGWYWHNFTGELAAALLAHLLDACGPAIEVGRSFTASEQRLLNDAVALVGFESGAERKAGPPASLAMLQERLAGLVRSDDVSLGEQSIALLAMTLMVIRTTAIS
jgi:hypothetical protein